MGKIYKAEEIARHNHSKDLLIVIHGNVYNLSEFYKEHPGGPEVLLQLAGKDGSKCFDSVGHSNEAIAIQEYYKVGEIEEGAILEQPDPIAVSKESTVTEQQDTDSRPEKQYKEKENSLLPLIAVTVAIYAFVIYYIWF